MAYCVKCGAPIYHTSKVEGPYFTSDWLYSKLCRQCEISDQLDHAFMIIELDPTTMQVFDSCRWRTFVPHSEEEIESIRQLDEMGLVRLVNTTSTIESLFYGWSATELGKNAIVSEGKLYVGVIQ